MATPTTLPASFTAGQVLTAAQMNDLRGAFRILQVVTAQYSTGVTNNTNVLADTGLTATITPQSATSKVLVIVNHQGVTKETGNAGSAAAFVLLRGATSILSINGHLYSATNSEVHADWNCIKLDSPATTSATTYKTQFGNAVNAAGVSINRSIGAGFQTSTIVLLEVSE
jgi:hypothetical protein